MSWFLHKQFMLKYVLHVCQSYICGYKQFKDLEAVAHLQNFTFCSPSSISQITQDVNNKKLRICIVCFYVMSLQVKRKSLSKSVNHLYSQFRKIYILIFAWFNFKWSMTLYLVIRYANKINKWIYIYASVLYTPYTSYMFWPLVWTSSGRCNTKDI
jgi:hypothetical protein